MPTMPTASTPFDALRQWAADHDRARDRQAQRRREEERLRLARQHQEQRALAVADAADAVRCHLPRSLGALIADTDWTGHPGAREAGILRPAAAVAHLGDGAVVHHETTVTRVWPGVTMALPCPCGWHYVEITPRDDEDLLRRLADVPRDCGALS